MRKQIRFHRFPRNGTSMMEAVVVLALFTTAIIAVARLANTSSKINLAADEKLSAKLAAHNAVARLEIARNTNEWNSARTQQIAAEMTEQTGMQIQIAANSFDFGQKPAQQVTVNVETPNGRIYHHHDWLTHFDGGGDEP